MDRFGELTKSALDGAQCHCHEGYTSRGKVDPSCVWCAYHESVREELVHCWNEAIEAAATAAAEEFSPRLIEQRIRKLKVTNGS